MISAEDCLVQFSSDVSADGVERPARVRALVDACRAEVTAGAATFDLAVLPVRLELSDAAAAPGLPLTLAHSVDYVRDVAAACERARDLGSDSSARLLDETVKAMAGEFTSTRKGVISFGSGCLPPLCLPATTECIRWAVNEVASRRRFAVTVLGRPPGHHAGVALQLEGDYSGGPSVANNAMLAAAAMALEHAFDRQEHDEPSGKFSGGLAPAWRDRLLTLLELIVVGLSAVVRGHRSVGPLPLTRVARVTVYTLTLARSTDSRCV